MDTKFPDSESVVGDAGLWLQRQLNAELKKLVRAVSILGYTRNPLAMSVAAEQCAHVETVLREYELQMQGTEHTCGIDELLLVEAHQMLAEARRLVSAPLEPVWRDDNVIELKPNYADLTDAAFERMLASSDIPQLLSAPASWAEDTVSVDDFEGSEQPASTKPHLRIVYSNDSPDA